MVFVATALNSACTKAVTYSSKQLGMTAFQLTYLQEQVAGWIWPTRPYLPTPGLRYCRATTDRCAGGSLHDSAQPRGKVRLEIQPMLCFSPPPATRGICYKLHKGTIFSQTVSNQKKSTFSPEFVRVLQKNRANRMCVNRKSFIIRNWVTQLERLASPKICSGSQQAEDPGEPTVQLPSKSESLRTRRTGVSVLV